MDKKTQEFINKMNRRAAEMFRTKEIKDDQSRSIREQAEWAYKKTGDPRIKEQLDRGIYNPKDRRVVDEESTKAISRMMDQQFKKALKTGEIKPAERDEFTKRTEKMMK